MMDRCSFITIKKSFTRQIGTSTLNYGYSLTHWTWRQNYKQAVDLQLWPLLITADFLQHRIVCIVSSPSELTTVLLLCSRCLHAYSKHAELRTSAVLHGHNLFLYTCTCLWVCHVWPAGLLVLQWQCLISVPVYYKNHLNSSLHQSS